MVDLVTLQATAYVAQIVGVVGTLTAAFIAVRSYINANKRAEDAKKKEQETRELELKAQQQNLETRQAQLYMQVYNIMASREFVVADNKLVLEWSKQKFTNWADFMDKYGPEANREDYLIWDQMGHIIEGMGVLVKNGLLNVQYVDDLMGGLIIGYWDIFRDAILDFRKINNYPAAWDMTELLYDKLTTERKKPTWKSA